MLVSPLIFMKSKAIEHIIWDWNGTLLDDTAACLATINRMLARRKLPILTLAEYRDIFGFPVKDCYIRLGIDLDVEDWDKVSEEFHGIYRDEARNTGLREGIQAVLDDFTSRRKTMSVLSASELSILRKMMVERGVAGYFKHIYGHGDLYGSSKIELGHKLLQDAGISADHILLIGDTDHDYEVARELKCRCILVTGGHQAEKRLRKCDCRIIENIVELLEVL